MLAAVSVSPATRPAAVSISADLIEASLRSDNFPSEWTREHRERSLDRYLRWLALKQLFPRARFAPTRDIDLFWHLHMLSPVAYYNDCMRLFGRILDHDGGFGKGEGELAPLRAAFERTATLWEQFYNEPYRDDGRWLRDAVQVNCWHDCQDRCWHACAE